MSSPSRRQIDAVRREVAGGVGEVAGVGLRVGAAAFGGQHPRKARSMRRCVEVGDAGAPCKAAAVHVLKPGLFNKTIASSVVGVGEQRRPTSGSALGMPFRDADAEVEAAAGRPIAEIFAQYGEPLVMVTPGYRPPAGRPAARRRRRRGLGAGTRRLIRTRRSRRLKADIEARAPRRAGKVARRWPKDPLDVLPPRLATATRPRGRHHGQTGIPPGRRGAIRALIERTERCRDARPGRRRRQTHDVLVGRADRGVGALIGRCARAWRW